MDDLLRPSEAAKLVGVPENQLRRWAWEQVGPKNHGTKRKPMYEQGEMERWRNTKMSQSLSSSSETGRY